MFLFYGQLGTEKTRFSIIVSVNWQHKLASSIHRSEHFLAGQGLQARFVCQGNYLYLSQLNATAEEGWQITLATSYFLNKQDWMSSNMVGSCFSTSASGTVTFAPVSRLTATHWRCSRSLGPTSRRIGTPWMRGNCLFSFILSSVCHYPRINWSFLTLSSQWLNFHPGE